MSIVLVKNHSVWYDRIRVVIVVCHIASSVNLLILFESGNFWLSIAVLNHSLIINQFPTFQIQTHTVFAKLYYDHHSSKYF